MVAQIQKIILLIGNVLLNTRMLQFVFNACKGVVRLAFHNKKNGAFAHVNHVQPRCISRQM